MPYFPPYQQPAYPALQAPVYNTYQQPQQQEQQPILARVATSKEEALAVPVDFMGRPTLILDMAHRVIYVKVFNTSTGCAECTAFTPAQAAEQPAYATVAAVDELKAEIEKLKQKLNMEVANESS